MEARLTRKMIETAKAPDAGSLWLRDTERRGLSVRVWRARGEIRRAYVISWPDGSGGTKTATVGHHGEPWKPDPNTGEARVLTLDLARIEAARLLGARHDGKDPAMARSALVGRPTLRQFAEKYRQEWATVEKAPRTVVEEDGNLARHLLPLMGDERLEAIGPAHVSRLKSELRAHPVTANRCRSLLSSMLNVAKLWGDVPASYVNPCAMVPKFDERGRERILTPDELKAIGSAMRLEEATAPVAVAALRVLMLTGARPVEILPLTQGQRAVALATGVLVQDSRKSRYKRRPVYFSPGALAVLESVRAVQGNEHVFPGVVEGRHLTHSGLGSAWERICRRAKVAGVRPYDLRHCFATVSMMLATNRKLVQELMGHSDPRTTERYLHVPAEPLRALSAETADEITKALKD